MILPPLPPGEGPGVRVNGGNLLCNSNAFFKARPPGCTGPHFVPLQIAQSLHEVQPDAARQPVADEDSLRMD